MDIFVSEFILGLNNVGNKSSKQHYLNFMDFIGRSILSLKFIMK